MSEEYPDQDPDESALEHWFPILGPAPEQPAEEQPAPAGSARHRRGAGRAARPGVRARIRSSVILGALAGIVVLVAAGLIAARLTEHGRTITAYFPETIGIYAGSDVRILGVKVGAVDSTQPAGPDVRVVTTIDSNVPVPAGARAVVVVDSIVADRYIQLTPAYTSGPELASGAVIPLSRTVVPVEVDQIYSGLTQFFNELGPAGVNKHGALSQAIRTGANVMDGNGASMSQMLTQFSALNKLMGDSAGNFFGTIAHLHTFSGMLASDDANVRAAETELASVTSYFAADRQNLQAAIGDLATALQRVQGFVADNRGLIKVNVDKLAAITDLLTQERSSLAETLDDAPLALDNLLNAYDGTTRTLDGRGDLNELSLGPAAKILDSEEGLDQAVPVSGAALRALPPLPLPATGPVYATPAALEGR
jgi:phospholipid/cholesterol/gamma-HCH transport system substrate-binding protein